MKTLLLLLLLLSFQVHAKTTVIAVIDTGFGIKDKEYNAKLCKTGHVDFSDSNISYKTPSGVVVPGDRHGHGTHVAGLIDSYAKKGKDNYCLVILKYFDPIQSNNENADNTVKAIKYATKIHADYINYSGGGEIENTKETKAVKEYLDGGGIFVSAAGNIGTNLAKNPYYPAMADSRVIVVGNIDRAGKIAKSSNGGTRVNCWEMGVKVLMYDMVLTGTSQATAITTGKLISKNPCGQKLTIDTDED